MSAISLATMVGSFALLPLISEPVCWLLADRVQSRADSKGVEVRKRCAVVKAVFLLACLVVMLSVLVVAVQVCQRVPTGNQYVLAASVFSGVFMATVGTNMLRSGV